VARAQSIPALPAIHGHRGARGRRPENTLAAVAFALEHGANGVEVDLCVTGDNQIVVHHDLRLNPDTTRDATGRWLPRGERAPLIELAWAALRELDVGRARPGAAVALRFGRQSPVDGARVPLLAEFVELMTQRAPGVTLNLELKSDPRAPALAPPAERYAALVADELARLRPAGALFLQSFDWALMARVKREMRARGVACQIAFTCPRPFDRAAIDAAADAGAAVFSCDYRGLDAELLRHARSRGLGVCAWTVNAAADIARLAALGVDAITTDYPERAREVLHGEAGGDSDGEAGGDSGGESGD